ncbi:MAG: hypothetical protein JXB13_03545 [Phycisphaerae bacterium]|nr:hypothetical protein [Phycisphaerae bacterium]
MPQKPLAHVVNGAVFPITLEIAGAKQKILWWARRRGSCVDVASGIDGRDRVFVLVSVRALVRALQWVPYPSERRRRSAFPVQSDGGARPS